jgi:predicted nucleic acid-binding protein
MIVVADSGPLHYLILLDHVDLLQRFYGQVLVPLPVASELSAAGAPGTVREWITTPPTTVWGCISHQQESLRGCRVHSEWREGPAQSGPPAPS